MNMKLLE